MAKIPPAYARVLHEHRRRLNRVIDRGSIPHIKKMYDRTLSEIDRKLSKVGPKSQKFAAHQMRLVRGQLRQGQMVLANRMVGHLSDLGRVAQIEALRGVIGDIQALEGAFTGADLILPIEEAARFGGVIDGRRASLLRMYSETSATWSANAIAATESALAMSLMEGETLGETVDRIIDVMSGEYWQAERVARTELIGAFNVTQYDGITEIAEEVPDMGMRWTEYVDDATLIGLDNRVDPDSVAMHGQIAMAGDAFFFPLSMPDGGPLPKRLARFVGQTWPCPPMRPNDRASLAPWRATWGLPGWRCVDGLRVPL